MYAGGGGQKSVTPGHGGGGGHKSFTPLWGGGGQKSFWVSNADLTPPPPYIKMNTHLGVQDSYSRWRLDTDPCIEIVATILPS